MKNKKKSILISSMIVLAMATPVFAEEINQDTENKSGTTTVTYGVTESYTISIPTSINFTDKVLEANGTVSASNVLIEDGKTLNVKMTSANYTDEDGYTLKTLDGASTIKYSIKNEETDFENGETVLSVSAGETTGEAELTFTTTADNIKEATKSGAHTDTLTFKVSVD